MSAPTACFENIIGLSRTECQCVDAAPEGANVSASGLYLDELKGMTLQKLNSTQACGSGGLWEKLAKARDEAIEETLEAVMAEISRRTDPARGIGRSQIGDDKKATATSHKLKHAYHGITLQTANVVGGAFYVEQIATAFKTTAGMPATITLTVYDRLEVSGDPIAVYVLPITGERIVWTPIEPLVLSMEGHSPTNPRYFFLFEPYSGAVAMNSVCSCGCGGYKPYWDVNAPQYLSRAQKNGYLWADWCMAAGTYGADLATRDQWATENPTAGLMLKVRFECDERSTLCTADPDYTGDPVQKVIAHAVRYRSGFNLLTDLIHSTDINRWTMTAGEQMAELRKEYDAAFQSRVQWLGEELSDKANINRYGDCRRCKDTVGMRRSTIPN